MSIQVINGKIISNYPVFEGSQVLTSEQLNGLFTYLDQQHRFTRSRLIGMGIVCGLHVQTNGNQVQLSEGIGITSDGFLVKMPDCTMSYRRDYFLPSNVVYEPFGGFDEDRIFSQYEDVELYELLSNEPESGGYQEIDSTFLNNKYLLIFLECYDRDPRSCLGKNCEDLGRERIFTTRKIAVNKAGLNKILEEIENDDRWSDAVVENPYFTPSALEYVSLRNPFFRPGEDPSIDYDDFVLNYANQLYSISTDPGLFTKFFGTLSEPGLLAQTYEQYQTILEPIYDYSNPFVLSVPVNTTRSNLSAFLGGSDSRNYLGIQSVYDFFDLLIKAYNEFVSTGEEFISQCSPMKYFPLHLMLGKINADSDKELDEWDSIGRSRYRHGFLQPEIHNSQKHLLKQLISLHKRLVLMVESFDINKLADTEQTEVSTKLTPTRQGPVGEQSIPVYFNLQQNGSVYGVTETTLEREWNYDTTIKSRKNESNDRVIQAFSYGRNAITPDNLTPSVDGLIEVPLAFHLDQNQLRIEGLYNKNSENLKEDLIGIRDHYNLAFEVLNLKIENETMGITVENRYWQDLQADYQIIKNANIATFRSLGGELKAFHREAENWDYSIVDANVSNFESEINKVLLDISNANPPGDLCDEIDAVARNFPSFVEDLYIGSDPFRLFPEMLAVYKDFRRALSRTLLVIQYADNILVLEKIAVIPPRVFDLWTKLLRSIAESINDFLSNNDFYQLQNLYERFKVRYDFLQTNHYSVFTNFIKLHPGIEHHPVQKGGTQLLVFQDPDNSNEGPVFADFSLPYRLDGNDIEIPLDPALDETKVPPLGRGEAVLLLEGQEWIIEVTSNNLDPNGDVLHIDQKGHVDGEGEFHSGESFRGARVVSPQVDGKNQYLFLRYGPLEETGNDYFQYTIKNTNQTDLKDVANVEVLVVAPYLEHVKALDDLAATDSDHTVIIEVLTNDTKYNDTELIIPTQSDFGVLLALTSDNKRIQYSPIYGREGKDSFTYKIRQNRGTTTDPIYELSTAQVEVIVFCCDKLEIELLCEGNIGEYDVLSETEQNDNAPLFLLDVATDPVQRVQTIDTGHSKMEVIEPPAAGYPYLRYVSTDKEYTGYEEFVYEVDNNGFIRRGRIQLMVIECAETRFERTLKDTTSDFKVIPQGVEGIGLNVFIERDELLRTITTENGSVEVTLGGDYDFLRYTPNPGYYGLDHFNYTITNADGEIHYNTMHVIIDGYEKVRVESTFQDTPAIYGVLDSEQILNGFSLKLYQNRGVFEDTIPTEQGSQATIDGDDKGAVKYTPKTSLLGDDTFHYTVFDNEGKVFEYGKFYVILDTNRKVSVEYTSRSQALDITVLSEDQVSQNPSVSLLTPTSFRGAQIDVIHGDRGPFIRYIPTDEITGQDSFGYLIEIGEVKLYGTVYIIVENNERVEVLSTFKNTTLTTNFFNPGDQVTSFEILPGSSTRYGTSRWIQGSNQIEYISEEDYVGHDKLKFKATVNDQVQYGTIFFLVTCECEDVKINGVVSDELGVVGAVLVTEVDNDVSTITKLNGRYVIDADPNGKLHFSKETHEPTTVDIQFQTKIDVSLLRKLVDVSGSVTDQNNSEPINDFTIQFRNREGNQLFNASENNSYEITVFVETDLKFSAPGYITQIQPVSAATNGRLNVQLVPDRFDVSGQVTDEPGDPVRGADVTPEAGEAIKTDANGNYTLSNISRNTVITYSADYYESQTETALVATSNLNVKLPGADIELRVKVFDKQSERELRGVRVTEVGNPDNTVITVENTMINVNYLRSLTIDNAPGFQQTTVLVKDALIPGDPPALEMSLALQGIRLEGTVFGNEIPVFGASIKVNAVEKFVTQGNGKYQAQISVWSVTTAVANGFDDSEPFSILQEGEGPIDVSQIEISDSNEVSHNFIFISKQPPDVSIKASNQTITCEHAAVTLTASSETSGVSFAWKDFQAGVNPINVQTPGTYEVTAIDPSSELTSTASIAIGIDVETPSVFIDVSSTSPGTALLLASSSNASAPVFVWKGFELDKNPIEVKEPGKYEVTVTNKVNGCTNSNSVEVSASDLQEGEEFILIGQVMDPGGQALPGTNVLIVGTTRGTVTDIDGTFRLPVRIGHELRVSSIGFKEERVKVVGPDFLKIVLSFG